MAMMTLVFKRFEFGRSAARIWALTFCVTITTQWGGHVLGQSVLQDVSPEEMLADQLVLLAHKTLGGQDEPRSDQMARAQILLDLALQLVPDDAEIWRLRTELAVSMDDRPGQREALKHYCALRPQDDAAQLRWIISSIREHQTIEGRIEAAAKIVDTSEAGRFSVALRSRLSSFIAASALELGDLETFVASLKKAVRLDPTNQDAARMMLEHLMSKQLSGLAVGQALMHLITADLADTEARIQLANILNSQGAYETASHQYAVANWLDRQNRDERFIYNWAHSLAATGKSNEALFLLDQFDASFEAEIADETKQEQIVTGSLPMDLELLRLAMRYQTGRKTQAAGSFKRIENLLREKTSRGDDQGQVDRYWLGLLMDQDVSDPLDQVIASDGVDEVLAARLTGWFYLRRGDKTAAAQAFHTHSDHDPFAAYGQAQLYDKPDDPNRLAQLQTVVAMDPENLAGMMAASDLVAAGVEPEASPQGKRLADLIRAWPKKLAVPHASQNSIIALSVRLSTDPYRYLQPITAHVRLRNTTDLPLSIGPGQSVSSRMILRISLRQGGASMGRLPPVVVDLQRQLRLAPRGKLDLDVRLDRSSLGQVLSMNPIWSVGFQVSAVVGPQLAPDGQVRAHPLGASDQVYGVNRRGGMMTPDRIDQWIGMMRNIDPIRQMVGSAWLTRSLTYLDDSEPSQEIITKISQALVRHYDQLPTTSQAWIIQFLPSGEKYRDMLDAIHESAFRSDDPFVRTVYAASHVRDPQAAAIDSMLRHSDERIATFGQALREGLIAEAEEEAEKDVAGNLGK